MNRREKLLIHLIKTLGAPYTSIETTVGQYPYADTKELSGKRHLILRDGFLNLNAII